MAVYIATLRREGKPPVTRRPFAPRAAGHDNSGMTDTRKGERLFTALAGILGALAVALGAYGAHGLEDALSAAPDAAKRLGWWETAVQYHLAHALAVAFVAWLAARGRGATAAGALFTAGIVMFSGTLYAMALGAPRWLGAVTPFGGLALIAGWIAVAASAFRREAPAGERE